MNSDFNNVKVAITEARMNVKQVADEMGITAQALYQKLNGRTKFTLKDMVAMKKILSDHIGKPLTLEYLFGDGNDN